MKNFDASQQFGKDFDWEKDGIDLRITPLPELHFLENVFRLNAEGQPSDGACLVCHSFCYLTDCGYQLYQFQYGTDTDAYQSINTQKVLEVRIVSSFEFAGGGDYRQCSGLSDFAGDIVYSR